MVTKRSYECNFCRQPFRKDEDVIGVEWDATGTLLRIRHRSTVENHICMTCLNAVRAIPTNLEPPSAP